jgi:hypothetical protein
MPITSLIGIPARSASTIARSRAATASAASSTRGSSFCAIGDVADRDRYVRSLFDDAAASGPAGGSAGEDREVVFAGFVDVASRAVHDDAGDVAKLGAEREVAAPARSVDACALLHDDHVSRLRRFDRRRTEVPRRRGLAGVAAHLDGNDPPGDPTRRRQPGNAGDGAGQGESIERVGHRAGVEPREAGESVSHSTPGPPEGGHYDQ